MNLSSLFFNRAGSASDASVQTVSPAAAVQLHGEPDIVFVDVRGVDEIRQSGTIKGAIRVPLPELARHADASGTAGLPAADAGKTLLLVCASGARSNAGAQRLVALGYPDVGNISGGIGGWKAAGGPMEP